MNFADPTPTEVLTRAYRAANRRRFSDANRYLTRRLRNMMLASAKGIRASNKALASSARRLESSAERTELTELVEGLRQFEDPYYCWKGSTQGGTIASIELVRQTVRQDRAFVTIRLRFRDGRTRVERSKLLKRRSQWLIDCIEVEVLQNNEMQRTKPAQAMELRR